MRLRMAMQADVSIYVLDPNGAQASQRSRAENSNPNSRYTADGYTEADEPGGQRRPRSPSWPTQSRGPLDGARYLAEESGGIAVVNTNDLQGGIERMVRDTSSYYLLGYHSTNTRTDGKFRRNDVKVSRSGVRVVHRNGYFAARESR